MMGLQVGHENVLPPSRSFARLMRLFSRTLFQVRQGLAGYAVVPLRALCVALPEVGCEGVVT